MKFGHPRVYNPWRSDEYRLLADQSSELMDTIDAIVAEANGLVTENRIVNAQMRDCCLTMAEQIAQLQALDEVGAPQ